MRTLLKMDFVDFAHSNVQMDSKSGQSKIESANRKTINTSEVRLIIQFSVNLITQLKLHLNFNFRGELQYLHIYKDAQKAAHGVALKGTLLVALELHLSMQLSMHKSVKNDSTF